MTIRTPFETHNVSGFTVNFFHGEDGQIVVEVPAIEGCFTQGKDREEALANAAEAIAVSVDPDSPIAQLIAERDEAHAEAKRLRAYCSDDATVLRLAAEVARLRAACNEARSAVVDFNDEDEATDLGIHEADERDVAMGNAWRILNAALGAAD